MELNGCSQSESEKRAYDEGGGEGVTGVEEGRERRGTNDV